MEFSQGGEFAAGGDRTRRYFCCIFFLETFAIKRKPKLNDHPAQNQSVDPEADMNQIQFNILSFQFREIG